MVAATPRPPESVAIEIEHPGRDASRFKYRDGAGTPSGVLMFDRDRFPVGEASLRPPANGFDPYRDHFWNIIDSTALLTLVRKGKGTRQIFLGSGASAEYLVHDLLHHYILL